MAEMFLPTLSYFEHKNVWTGSRGRMSYRIEPSEQIIKVEVWPGPWCYAFSEVERTKEFPLSIEGIEVIRSWLTEQDKIINSRPSPTPEEINAQFAAIKLRVKEQTIAKAE